MTDLQDESPGAGADTSRVAAWRWVAAGLSVACVAAALRRPRIMYQDLGWYLLAAALLFAIAWTMRLRLVPPAAGVPRGWRWWRIVVGGLIALAGAAAFAQATQVLYLNWTANFDRAWLTWVGATVLMAVGLDVASGPWKRIGGAWRPWHVAIVALLLVVAAVYRTGNILQFPGEGTATQIEDLQTGQWGYWYSEGLGRLRWEYLSHQWLAAVGIWLGGPTMNAMRVPFAVVSALKTVPLFAWLFMTTGPVGAIVGTALFACSAWDTVLSRTANNQNAIIVATAFALLAGPVRRGRPSAFVLLGLFGGYLLHEYVAYRPAIALVLAGAAWLSLRERGTPWIWRIARPLVPVALIVAMGVPLFLGRLSGGRVWDEYFNGWNRARVIGPYYNQADSWSVTIDKRVDRAFDAVSLFIFSGDSHPARWVGQALVDPVTGTFLVLGVGCAIAHWTQPVMGLTIAGLLITITGTLVMTGNFDVARVGGAVPYVFACAGYGAASLDALARGRGRGLRIAVWAAFALAVVWAGGLNTRALFRYWSSPSVHRALRHNLAYLSTWLRQNARPTEQIVAVAPGYHHVLQDNDAAWLRGRAMTGIAAWDVEGALKYWAEHPGKTLLVVFAGSGTPTVQRYVETLLPGLHMQFMPDPLKLEGEVAYAHVDDRPTELLSAISAMRCLGLSADLTIVDRAGATVFTTRYAVPFLDASAIPSSLRTKIFQLDPPPARVTARFSGAITITTPGQYRFWTQVYPGSGTLLIDQKVYGDGAERGIPLAAGQHELQFQATFNPDALTMVARLYWQGPDSGNQREIAPLYRISVADPACVAATVATDSANAPAVNP